MTSNTINQISHFLAGMLGVLGPIALFGRAKNMDMCENTPSAEGQVVGGNFLIKSLE